MTRGLDRQGAAENGMKDWERWLQETLRGKHEPSGRVLGRALDMGRRLRDGLSPRPVASRIELLFDSALGLLAEGLRQHAPEERRLLYRIDLGAEAAGEYELDLHLRRRQSGELELTGQLLPPLKGATLEVKVGEVRRRESLAGLGEFVVRRLPARAQNLRIRIRTPEGRHISIPTVPLIGRSEGHP